MCSAKNCLQLSGSFIYCVFSRHALPTLPFPIPNNQKTCYLKGLSCGIIGFFRSAACIWQPTRCATVTPSRTDEKSPLDWSTSRRNSSLFMVLSNIWPELRIIRYCTGPAPFARECSCLFIWFFPVLSLSLHVMVISTACSWHWPRNKTL